MWLRSWGASFVNLTSETAIRPGDNAKTKSLLATPQHARFEWTLKQQIDYAGLVTPDNATISESVDIFKFFRT